MICNCRICGKQSGSPIFKAHLLGNNVEYYDCELCGYVQTQPPTWLNQAYSSAINNCDYGIMSRNILNVGIVKSTMLAMGNIHDRVVDYAGGYGILVRLLKDQGINAEWYDPYCANIFAKGFEYTEGKAVLVTAFEAFEHFEHPVKEIEKLFSIAPNILFSTEIIPTPAPAPNNWWYYGLNHGQHIGFYRVKTLKYLANKYNKNIITDGRTYHIFSEKPISQIKWRALKIISKRLPLTLRILKRLNYD